MRRTAIPELRAEFSAATLDELPGLIALHDADERAGARAVLSSARRRLESHRAEMERLARLAEVESGLYAQGCVCVAGVDEVGRGALAGPLTVGAVVLAPEVRIHGLDDSKRLRPEQRVALAEEIRMKATSWSIAHVEAVELDALGMTAALRKAMNAAVAALVPAADHVVVDGRPMGLVVSETSIIKGDSKVASIAAASIIAKVERDALMRAYEDEYPGYEFAVNKGYGTAEHMSAIDRLGLTPIHRRSFSPCGGTMPLF